MLSEELLQRADTVAKLLAVLGNTKRFLILCHLLNGELSVGAIAEKVNLSQSALSQHLAKLRSMDIVETRRVRQTIYYSCHSKELQIIFATLDEAFGDGGTNAARFGGSTIDRQART
jgi:DNA-binding transcriptional ArsR family regulator